MTHCSFNSLSLSVANTAIVGVAVVVDGGVEVYIDVAAVVAFDGI